MANVFTAIGNWVNERAPGMMPAYRKHMTEYYAPKNFNFWYYFGSLALLVLVNQLLTGIWLAMHYKPDEAQACPACAARRRAQSWPSGASSRANRLVDRHYAVAHSAGSPIPAIARHYTQREVATCWSDWAED